MRGTNSKNEKNNQETTFFRLEGMIWFLAQFGGEIGVGKHFFKVEKWRNPHVSSPDQLGGVDFLICYITFDFLSIGLRKHKFCVFNPS